jgi:hypothetical protein
MKLRVASCEAAAHNWCITQPVESRHVVRVQELKDKGLAYPCFCSDEELEAMKAAAEAAGAPPVYDGKWASADPAEVKAALDAGTPHCYRYRVPANKEVVVKDLIRGDVTFNTNTLGDFVVMRSNGLPVRTDITRLSTRLARVCRVTAAVPDCATHVDHASAWANIWCLIYRKYLNGFGICSTSLNLIGTLLCSEACFGSMLSLVS